MWNVFPSKVNLLAVYLPPGPKNAALIRSGMISGIKKCKPYCMIKRSISTALTILVTAALSIGLYVLISSQTADSNSKGNKQLTAAQSQADYRITSPVEFVSAARATTPAIVHIRTFYNAPASTGNPLQELFGLPQRNSPARGSGSGVTITEDGYIVTNNHVVEHASQVEVVFPDRRTFRATIAGRDPATDLALIKVKSNGLPSVKMGNSDSIEVGEWVLAIGYPFSLNTTVTAGIISAKGRSIGILDRPARQSNGEASEMASPVESFIQTDAAINPGNSGGALVNTSGELIGINAAIASLTGSYAGYGFAIPSNLVKKVIDDIREFGEVRRAYLGVTFPAPATEEQYFRQQGINPASVSGVLITGVQKGSAATEAGIQPGDVIQSVDGIPINSSAEFSERIARHRPGDEIRLGILRKGDAKTVTAKLKGQVSLTQKGNSLQSLEEIYNKLGASFAPLTPAQKQHYRIRSGVVITEIRQGGLFDQMGLIPGTIVIMINGRSVNNPKDINEILTSAENSRIRIDGIAPDGSRIIFTFSLGA